MPSNDPLLPGVNTEHCLSAPNVPVQLFADFNESEMGIVPAEEHLVASVQSCRGISEDRTPN